ncbi:MAG: glycogen debranching protein GlgX [Pseudomonadota bacterium]
MTGFLTEGQPSPFGAHFDGRGVNFALFSANAEKVELCLFDDKGQRETHRTALPEHTDDIWHGYFPDVRPGQLYGYRVHGPYDPEAGHRFNPHKLLIDPYARALDRPFAWNDLNCGYIVGDARGDLSFDTRDNAALMPKCRIVEPRFDWIGDTNPQVPLAQSIIYELHPRGYTMRHSGIAEGLRGSCAALADSKIVGYLRELGISAVELLPVHPASTSRALWQSGLIDYWGYNSISFFALESHYLASGQIDEFKRMVRAFHDAGIEVILDVVFNHTGEGDELGPTVSFRGIDNASYYCLAENKRHYLDFTGCKNTLNLGHPRVLQMVMESLHYWTTEMHVDGFRFDLAVSLARVDHHFSRDAGFFAAIQRDPILAKSKLIAEPWDLGPDGYQLGAFPQSWSEWNDKYRDTMRRFWRGDGGLLGDFAKRLAGSSDVFAPSGRGPAAGINFVTAHDGFTLEDLVSYATKHNEANGEGNRDGSDANFSANYGIEGESDNSSILALRLRQKRNLMATLLLSEGIPMLTAGDEFGRTQKGNNNAYCQDNETSWLNWNVADVSFGDFVRHLLHLRAQFPAFRRSQFFGNDRADDAIRKDIMWLLPDGRELAQSDWDAPGENCLGIRYAGADQGLNTYSLLLLVNVSPLQVDFVLPPGLSWRCLLDTVRNGVPRGAVEGKTFALENHSLALLIDTSPA